MPARRVEQRDVAKKASKPGKRGKSKPRSSAAKRRKKNALLPPGLAPPSYPAVEPEESRRHGGATLALLLGLPLVACVAFFLGAKIYEMHLANQPPRIPENAGPAMVRQYADLRPYPTATPGPR